MRLIRKHVGGRVRLWLSAMLLVTLISASSRPSLCAGSDEPDSLGFTAAEVESVITALDDQALKIRLLEIQLWRLKQYRAIDSTLAVETRLYYEERIAEEKRLQDAWWERIIKAPIVWFAIGAYLGVQASAID